MKENTTIQKKVKKIMHILNPLAGKGKAVQIKESIDDPSCVYMSSSAEDASEFIEKACAENPDTCFTIYGGDGTVFKTVNALMRSGCSEQASLKIVPVGSGNDFVRSFEGQSGEFGVDVMKFNDKYAVNVINIGFDCEVVRRTAKIKKTPLVTGKMAYILGVAGEFVTKKPTNLTITLTYADGTMEVIEDKILLAAIANGKWYGGGFKVAPIANTSDGLLDVIIVKNISRRKFISLVGDYKKGTHIDPEKEDVIDKFKEFVYFRRCVAIKIEGCDSVCADGEIFEENTVDVKVIPQAINYIID